MLYGAIGLGGPDPVREVAAAIRREIEPGDRIWLGSPLFYGLGAANVVPMAIMTRATLVVQDRFDPAHALDVIERHACNVFYGTSNMIRRIYECPAYRRERVRSLEKGSAGIAGPERRILLEEMGVARACTAYGATELAGMCFASDPDDDVETKVEFSGYPFPGFEAEVVDRETRRPLPRGELGLLKVRGLTALGYYNDPERTAEVFDADGFYWTGDLGWFDERGYFKWHSRASEMIKSGGINLAPAEIENLLVSHPAVSEAHVIGVPDRVNGECAVAFVVADGDVDEAQLKEYVRGRAASFKVPQEIHLLPAGDIPRTASSKVAKSALREMWSAIAASRGTS
jgi:fatty-acyl-CoA synthase